MAEIAAYGSACLTVGRIFLLAAVVCLLIVVVTHVAEAFRIFPAMGWGLPNSVGHYIDLVSASLGIVLLLLGFIIETITRRRNSNWPTVKCPLWVKSRHLCCKNKCPLYPRKRTF